uniref:Vesicle-associated membrane protein 7 n=1 Tax=Arion vulgaris TaxID=1028688 RepID=A0A0B6Y7B5_9EUPU
MNQCNNIVVDFSYEFHCLTEDGILFVCATESSVAKQQPYGFLSEIKRRFQNGTVYNRAETAGYGELDKDFGFVMSQQMQKFSQPGAGNSGSVAAVQAQVDEVKGVMSQNIERVLQRGDRLEDLMDKTEELEAGAASFQRTARKIKTRYWWRNKKMTLILICVGLIVILVIVLIILFSTHVLPVKDDDKKDTSATTPKP